MATRFPATFVTAVFLAIPLLIGTIAEATVEEAVGVLESKSAGGPAGASEEGKGGEVAAAVATWWVDGRPYVFDGTVPVPGPKVSGGEAAFDEGDLVRVAFEKRNGRRCVTGIQALGYGPGGIQDGPHLIWRSRDSATLITVVDGVVIRTEHTGLDDTSVIETPSRAIPRIRLARADGSSQASWPDASRVLAVSDLEGNRTTFLSFLNNNGVVDEDGGWIWGDGHLVLNGDIVDRGDEVTELLWTIRRLEREAEQAGGRVHYVLGNHESMVMAGDLRYIHPNYRFTTDRIGMSYEDLVGPETELGRWLRDHDSVVRVGPFLFVHAGYSPELDRLDLELDEINRAIRTGLGPPAWPAEARAELRSGLTWHAQGPHWYRGYFPQHAERWGGRPTDEELAAILERHGADHIVVGHTVVDDVGWIDGRRELIGIDVAWEDPSEAAGLLFDRQGVRRVDADGTATPLGDPVGGSTE
ncbi:MAG: hypothetical protein GY895_10665 [Phycisphaera sp.]|nr:hypothetical protein [Phycisphaera sp.]